MEISSLDVIRYLDVYDIKHAHKGYRYLISAIELGAENPRKLMKIGSIYQEIAKKNQTGIINVERNIRYAAASLNMTNKELIVKVIDDLRYNYLNDGTRSIRMPEKEQTPER